MLDVEYGIFFTAFNRHRWLDSLFEPEWCVYQIDFIRTFMWNVMTKYLV